MSAGVGPVDVRIREGAMQQFFPLPLPAVPGLEVAGIVDEVGEGVSGVSVGDGVFGHTNGGGYAQYAVIDDVAAKPDDLSWEIAAALPVAVETSDRVLGILGLTAGETLLIHGAAGVTASVGAQLAVANGVTVIGTASPANHDYLRNLGAIPISYGDGWVERVQAVAPGGVDAIWDAVGAGVLEESISLRGGVTDRIVTIADPRAYELGIDFSTGPRHDFTAALAAYAKRFAAGDLTVRIDQTLPLADAAQAQDIVGSGHARGKVILQPWSN
jgi:NADPH:quinone reductase-like Zn-dependent oxidoreductase